MKEATTKGDKTGKDIFKLFNNAVFGTTMENLRKRINFEVVTSRKVALKRSAKPNFQRAKVFREDLVGVHMANPVLMMNRPIQVGFAILDLSKYLMYDFHYDTWRNFLIRPFSSPMQTRWRMKLLDMICMLGWVKSKMNLIFQIIQKKNHFLQSYDNMKVVGKFKDECKGQSMLRFVGIRPKL